MGQRRKAAASEAAKLPEARGERSQCEKAKMEFRKS